VRPLAVVMTSVAATLAGFGWLYLLYRRGALGAGPLVPEALPLQRLAGGAAQPLSRVLIAWLPVGVAAGVALRWAGLGRRRAVAVVLVCLPLLLAMGAAADAVTASEPLARHVAPQLQRSALWMAVGLLAAGAALP
jgi:hypothetical protein